MRYQIHRLQQEALIELGLNTEDALLLDWILNWKDGSSMERIVVNNNDIAYWVNYSKVVEELPILFKKTRGFSSIEEEEKAKKANTTKVARMLKGNLSKVLTRHEKKVQGQTKVYISFNREILDYLINNKNKKASTEPPVKADKNHKNNFDNNSIPQSNKKDTKKEKENMETIPKSEVVKIIEKSCVNIKKEDLKYCEEEFTNIDKLKEALIICEKNNSHGIKALRMAYKYGENNNNYKPNSFHNCRNRVLDYTKDELDEILKANEKRKKLQREQRELDDKDIDIKDFNIKEYAEKSIMDDEYFESLEEGYKIMVIDYINKNKIFKPSWIK